MKDNSNIASGVWGVVKPVLKFAGKLVAVIAAAGVYDFARNKPADRDVAKRYFAGNGGITWLLSPINTLLDLLSLPYVNKGIYTIDDLPDEYRAEVQRLIEGASQQDVVAKLEALTADRARTMVFFKWYGAQIENSVDIPAFNDDYKYIQTIGVSVFNKKQSTSKHFGPFRATLRVLYNINQMNDKSAYINVGDVNHYWKDEKLFIFDDTLMHQSFNESEQVRYCLFVDILRPSLIPAFFQGVVTVVRFFLKSVNFLFYKNWDVVKA
ncbi:MAG TPA: aspartyl/asparaginyl beta-hydroxylase domain-containing protein [Capsulimonadaceae bacterium]|jgi:beta-hydroxylase